MNLAIVHEFLSCLTLASSLFIIISMIVLVSSSRAVSDSSLIEHGWHKKKLLLAIVVLFAGTFGIPIVLYIGNVYSPMSYDITSTNNMKLNFSLANIFLIGFCFYYLYAAMINFTTEYPKALTDLDSSCVDLDADLELRAKFEECIASLARIKCPTNRKSNGDYDNPVVLQMWTGFCIANTTATDKTPPAGYVELACAEYDGYQAYHQNVFLIDNPHKGDKSLHERWDYGYHKALNES